MASSLKRRNATGSRLYEGAIAAAMPRAALPMLATLIDGPFDSEDWIFEPKFDGLRVLARCLDDRVLLSSRNQQSQNVQFPEIVKALSVTIRARAIVDGEVICLDDQGRSSFRRLQQRFHVQNPREVEIRRARDPAYVCLFDVLYADGFDVRGLPLDRRKRILKRIVRWSDEVRWTENYPGAEGTKRFREACRTGGEGLIGKYRHSGYAAGRSDRWVKVKCLNRQEFAVGGFSEPQGARQGIGSLLVGYYDDGSFRYAGKVGTGYSDAVLRDLRQLLNRLEQPESPFVDAEVRRQKDVHWVRPQLAAEIAFSEWTQHGRLRHPRFEGLRPDKAARDCRREKPRARRLRSK
jgi:bifunctional non-homologous end joining protein LigD